MSEMVYLDHAAATPTDPGVVRAMEPYWTADFGNPASVHAFGAAARRAVEESRATIARFINAQPAEIIFTSTGTESNNLAVLGVARANRKKGRRIITTVIEHPSILNACRALEHDGFEVIYLPVGRNGLLNIEDLRAAINDQTILVTTHYGNSELGVLQPVDEIGVICRKNNIYFHVDACQAMAYVAIDVKNSNIDLLTFNGSKMYGPKGIAVLYVRDGVNIFPIIYGGGQQESLRSGTENVPGIVGLAAAAEVAAKNRQTDAIRLSKLRDYLATKLLASGATINVAGSARLPNHLSATIETSQSNVVEWLSDQRVAVSSGSACSSKDISQSHVLSAIGLSADKINRTIRITLGRSTTAASLAVALRALKKAAP